MTDGDDASVPNKPSTAVRKKKIISSKCVHCLYIILVAIINLFMTSQKRELK